MASRSLTAWLLSAPALASRTAPSGGCHADAELPPGGLDCLGASVDNSWIQQLEPDPDEAANAPNTLRREVEGGHYVRVRPKPLPDAYFIACAEEMLEEVGLNASACSSSQFLRLFSGDTAAVKNFDGSWATPYALSIYGSPQVPNGAGPRGFGYGDGRAISIAEVVGPDGERWELQLKGSGPTPFCRGSDGRAVVRSSVREFLVSEAMYHLGVSTTRAISLVASRTELVARPWYKDGPGEAPVVQRGAGEDIMQHEYAAMTTRVSQSFLRVGHFELYGRRAKAGDKVGLRNLEQLARHALFREYPEHRRPDGPLQPQLLAMLRDASKRFALMAADWLRVGYTQSNFNADNCLVAGRTVDYGPFGFLEKYDPEWGMWVGSGQHFAFGNQPNAALRNFAMFAFSLEPLMDREGKAEVQRLVQDHHDESKAAVDRMYASKLGFVASTPAVEKLWVRLEALARKRPTDWTIMWRQLAEVATGDATESSANEVILLPLERAFYEAPSSALARDWAAWIRSWWKALADTGRPRQEAAVAMKRVSPKYIPREWMLIEAYTATQQGDHGPLRKFQAMFRTPFDEQPEHEERYYQRQAPELHGKAGIGFMS